MLPRAMSRRFDARPRRRDGSPSRGEPPRPVVYRVIRRPSPTLQDFRSDAEKGKTPLPLQVEDPRLYTGISAFAPLEWAASRAKKLHLGEYLAEMHVPPEIAVDKTFGPGHSPSRGRPSSVWSASVLCSR